MNDSSGHFVLEWTPAFTKSAKRYLKKNPEMLGRFKMTLAALENDPSATALRLHPLRGRLADCHAVRVNYADRIIISLKLTKRRVVLLDVGSHDEVY